MSPVSSVCRYVSRNDAGQLDDRVWNAAAKTASGRHAETLNVGPALGANPTGSDQPRTTWLRANDSNNTIFVACGAEPGSSNACVPDFGPPVECIKRGTKLVAMDSSMTRLGCVATVTDPARLLLHGCPAHPEDRGLVFDNADDTLLESAAPVSSSNPNAGEARATPENSAEVKKEAAFASPGEEPALPDAGSGGDDLHRARAQLGVSDASLPRASTGAIAHFRPKSFNYRLSKLFDSYLPAVDSDIVALDPDGNFTSVEVVKHICNSRYQLRPRSHDMAVNAGGGGTGDCTFTLDLNESNHFRSRLDSSTYDALAGEWVAEMASKSRTVVDGITGRELEIETQLVEVGLAKHSDDVVSAPAPSPCAASWGWSRSRARFCTVAVRACFAR